MHWNLFEIWEYWWFCVHIFCFSFLEEKIRKRTNQFVQDHIPPPSIYIHMCTLCTYANTYMPRFSPSIFFGPSRCSYFSIFLSSRSKNFPETPPEKYVSPGWGIDPVPNNLVFSITSWSIWSSAQYHFVFLYRQNPKKPRTRICIDIISRMTSNPQMPFHRALRFLDS